MKKMVARFSRVNNSADSRGVVLMIHLQNIYFHFYSKHTPLTNLTEQSKDGEAIFHCGEGSSCLCVDKLLNAYVCTRMSLCVTYGGARVLVCMHADGRVECHVSSSLSTWLFLGRVSCWAGAHWFDWSGWSESSSDLPVSLPSAPGSQTLLCTRLHMTWVNSSSSTYVCGARYFTSWAIPPTLRKTW